MHFEQAHDWGRAVVDLLPRPNRLAGNMLIGKRSIIFAVRIAAVERLPEDERREHELPLVMSLALNLQVTKGYAAPEVEELHGLRVHAEPVPEVQRDIRVLFPVLWGIWVYHKVRSDLPLAHQLGERTADAGGTGRRRRLSPAGDPGVLAVTALCQGKCSETISQMERAEALYDPKQHGSNVRAFGQDPGVATFAFGSLALCLTGQTDRAIEMMR